MRSRFSWISRAFRTRASFDSDFFIGGTYDRIQKQLRSYANVLRIGPFQGTVADAQSAGDENHSRPRNLGHLHGVMSRSRRHDFKGEPLRPAAALDQTNQALIQRNGSLVSDGHNIDAQLPLPRD